MNKVSLTITNGVKQFRSPEFNYNFRISDGFFQKWGKTYDEDPTWSIYGNDIADIELSDGESCPVSCAFCYKGNKKGDAAKSTHMSLETFKDIFNKFPKYDGIPYVCQIAFGITSVSANKDLFPIFQFCRDNNVIPNVTVNGADPLTDEEVNTLVKLTGAMAISINSGIKDKGYDLIERLVAAGARQLNIHYVISKQSINFAYQLVDDLKNNLKLKGINAVVFLGLKPKNRGQAFDVLPTEEYTKLVNHAISAGIGFGFDSCSSPRFETAVGKSNIEEKLKSHMMSCAERCESSLFSAYIDTYGHYWHCSFGEGMEIANGIDMKNVKDFMAEVWNSEKTKQWRNRLFELNRECPLYKEIHINPDNSLGIFPEKV